MCNGNCLFVIYFGNLLLLLFNNVSELALLKEFSYVAN